VDDRDSVVGDLKFDIPVFTEFDLHGVFFKRMFDRIGDRVVHNPLQIVLGDVDNAPLLGFEFDPYLFDFG
jgi:hypothetical protein